MPVRSRGRLIALAAAAVLTAALVTLIVVLTPWDPLPGATITSPPAPSFFTTEQIQRSDAYFAAIRWPSWIGLGLHLGGGGRRRLHPVRSPAGRAGPCGDVRRWWLQVIVLTLLVVLLARLVTLPTAIWIHHVAGTTGCRPSAGRVGPSTSPSRSHQR